jgi:hypothetical protein
VLRSSWQWATATGPWGPNTAQGWPPVLGETPRCDLPPARGSSAAAAPCKQVMIQASRVFSTSVSQAAPQAGSRMSALGSCGVPEHTGVPLCQACMCCAMVQWIDINQAQCVCAFCVSCTSHVHQPPFLCSSAGCTCLRCAGRVCRPQY